MRAWRVRKHLEGGLERVFVLLGVRKGAVVAAAGDGDGECWLGACML